MNMRRKKKRKKKSKEFKRLDVFNAGLAEDKNKQGPTINTRKSFSRLV